MEAISGLRRRIFKSLEGLVHWTTKSLRNPQYQLIIGAVIVVYTAFLESDRESVLSIAMRNPLGRLGILSVLALLAVSAPPLAILFAVLVVLSSAGRLGEGFWAEPSASSLESADDVPDYTHGQIDAFTDESNDAKKDSNGENDKSSEQDDKKDDTETKASALQDIASKLQGMLGGGSGKKEGFQGSVIGFDKDANRYHSL